MNIDVGLSSNSSVKADENNRFYIIADSHADLSSGSAIMSKNQETPIRKLNDILFERINSGEINFTLARVVDESVNGSLVRQYLEVFDTGRSDVFLVRGDSAQKLDYRVKDSLEDKVNGQQPESKESSASEDSAVKTELPAAVRPLYYNRFELRKGYKVVIVSKEIGLGDDQINKIVRKKDPQKAASALVEKSGMYNASAIVVGAEDENNKPKKYSRFAKAALAAGAALTLGVGILGYLIYSRSEEQKPVKVLAGEEQVLTQQSLDEYVWNIPGLAFDKGVKHGSKAGKTPETHVVRKGDNLWNIVKREYGLKDDNEIAKKVNEIVELNAGKYPNLEKDTLFVDSKGRLRHGEDGIKGDEIYPGQKLALEGAYKPAGSDKKGQNKKADEKPIRVKTASSDYSIDRLVESYSRATFRDPKDMKGFDEHARQIADHYAKKGIEDTLDTYSMLNDNPEMLKSVLRYAYSELGVRRKTSVKSLSDYELAIVKEAYLSGTNKKALERIEQETGMKMSETTMYSVLKKYEEMTGEKVSKTNKQKA